MITKDQAINELVSTLERGYAIGKISLAELWAIGLLIDARKYETPAQLIRANTIAVVNVL